MNTASPKTYDHRLRNLVHATQDMSIALDLGVPRSTAYGWIRSEPPEVVTPYVLNLNEQQLQYELTKIKEKYKRLLAIIRLLVVMIRTVGIRIDYSRIPDTHRKTKILHVIESTKTILPLKSVLKIIGISSSRYHVWDKKQHCDNLDDESSCPKTSPNQLNAHNTEMPHCAFNGQTPDEIYYRTCDKIPQELKAKRDAARFARMEANRAISCEVCLNRKEAAA